MSTNTSNFRRWDVLTLWSSPDKFWIEASKSKTHLLQINRCDSDTKCGISLEPHLGQIPASATKKAIYGIVGIVELPLCQFLLVITRRVQVGELGDERHRIYQVSSIEMIPVQLKRRTAVETDPMLDEVQHESQARCINLLHDVLCTPYFYYSPTLDLTNSMQRLHKQGPLTQPSAAQGKEAWDRLDERFVWNAFALTSFLEIKANSTDLHAFIMPLIHGALFIKKCNINKEQITWSILSRRSKYRTGTRFFVRGSDDNGNVANFCETEQILEKRSAGLLASYVQTRGSMPMKWTQTPDIHYKPKTKLIGGKGAQETKNVFSAHFAQQKSIYGDQVAVNLIDKKKSEGELEDAFRTLFNECAVDGVTYEYFDFHRECAKMRYDRLSLLMDQLSKYNMGFFCTSKEAENETSSSIIRQQTGVFRTNCMDCLDRTNVVQSMLAAENLVTVLSSSQFGVLPANTTKAQLSDREPSFQTVFNHTWADHANLISVQYAGTGALKTDYTRTGKRTKWGLLCDGWNSGIRYYKNNFTDGFRTDGMHFFLGDLTPKDVSNGIVSDKYRKSSAGALLTNLPKALLIAIVMALFTLVFGEIGLKNGALVLVSFTMAALFQKLILQHADVFVDYPLSYLKEQRMTRASRR